MDSISRVNWLSIWAKRLALAAMIGLLCFVGGHGALLIFGLTWEFEPFRVAVFGIGCAVHVGAVVALSEAKRIRSGGLVLLSIVGLFVGAALDGRFAAEHILATEGESVGASASADELRKEAATIAADIERREAELSALREETERMDRDGDTGNDGQVKANRALISQREQDMAARRLVLASKQAEARQASVGAAVAVHARSVTLRLTDGMSDARKILTFWAAGSVVMLLMSGVIAAGTWFVGLMSDPEACAVVDLSGPGHANHAPTPASAPAPLPTGPGGGESLAPTEDEGALSVDETGLGYRRDKSRTPVWNRRVNGRQVYLRLPAGLEAEELRRVVDCLNRVAESVEPCPAPVLRVVR